MYHFKAFILFYAKILWPAAFMSTAISIVEWMVSGSFSALFLGGCYVFMGVVMHIIQYELRYKAEYIFYHNLGWTRLGLWIASTIAHIIIGILIAVL